MRVTHALSLCLSAILFTACAAGGDESGAGEAPPLRTFSRTIVTLHADGTQTALSTDVTEEEQQTEKDAAISAQAARAAGLGIAQQASGGPIARDSSCQGSDMWMFDGLNQTGNEICFYNENTSGPANVDFSSYCTIGNTLVCPPGEPCYCLHGTFWKDHVRSYWAGTSDGFFWANGYTCPAACGEFNAYQQVNTADTCEQSTWHLTLNGFCAPT
jgi:hypothetical protein